MLNRHLDTRRGKTIVVSFADSAIEVFRANAPEIDVATGLETTAAFWASTQGPLPGASDQRHVAVQPPLELEGITVVTEDFIADAHASGLAVHPWTIDDESRHAHAAGLGRRRDHDQPSVAAGGDPGRAPVREQDGLVAQGLPAQGRPRAAPGPLAAGDVYGQARTCACRP